MLAAFVTESERLSAELSRLDEGAWTLPTACEPWTVRELLGHITVTISWLPGMLRDRAPAKASVSARQYYRPDPRFSPQTNSRRIELGRESAGRAGSCGADMLAVFEHEWRHVAQLCASEPADRVVRTRHGDAMLLNDFLATRVVEVAVHGLDLAAALDRAPWLTAPAADLLTVLLAGDDGAARLCRRPGWEPAAFVAKATGRAPISEAEKADLARIGVHWLTLG